MGHASAASVPLIGILTLRKDAGKLYGKDMRSTGVI
jgi:hypothetical protein